MRTMRLGLFLFAGSLVLAGCKPGYPERSSAPTFTSAAFFGYLESVVHGSRSDVRSMDLVDACTLKIAWADGAVRRYDVMQLRIVTPSADDGERYALLLRGREGAQRLLAGTEHWGQYMTARSSFNHLRGFCARSRRGS